MREERQECARWRVEDEHRKWALRMKKYWREKNKNVDVAFRGADLRLLSSSARDQLTNQAVAVKKIMKPFSTPVLAKRTYRELKLLKHLRHENVGSRGRSSGRYRC
jgi:serine/threonine protein kinase